MAEDDRQNGLRVGGWVPPYSTDGTASGAPGRRATRPALPGTQQRRALGPGGTPPQSPRRGVLLAAVLALGCAAVALIAFNTGPERNPEPVAAGSAVPLPVLPYEPPATIPLLPKPSRSSASKVVIPTSHAAARVTSRPVPPSRESVQPPKPPPAQAVALTAGSTVGLEVAGRPGNRLRHRDFTGRIDPITGTSGAVDRADSGFVVRAGLADGRCFSLESVNFPGYFLRHRNFEIHLDEMDRTNLFREDSTFCTVTIRRGTALVLRSLNYPARYVTADGERLALRESTAEAATGFVPRKPL